MAKYSIEDTTLTNIANAIRNEASDRYGYKSKAYKPENMPDAISDVCYQQRELGYEDGIEYGTEVGKQEGFTIGYEDGIEAGKQQEYDLLWDAIQIGGTRSTGYNLVFNGAYWNDETFKPKYTPMDFGTDANNSFNNTNITKLTREIADFSKVSNMQTAFTKTGFVEIDVDFSSLKYANWSLMSNSKLETATITVSEALTGSAGGVNSYMFNGSTKLKDLTINGVWNINGHTVFSSCPLLTHKSLLSILNALADKTGVSGWSITLGATNLAKLTDAEKAIATQKGWTLA